MSQVRNGSIGSEAATFLDETRVKSLGVDTTCGATSSAGAEITSATSATSAGFDPTSRVGIDDRQLAETAAPAVSRPSVRPAARKDGGDRLRQDGDIHPQRPVL